MNYHRFCRWQQAEPHYVNRHQDIVQHCHNCGTEFRDNFCPRCGQRAEVGRVGWNSIKDNIAILWGLDSRSLTYTLVQLLGRPGYLVRDYISGHRQVSFPPVKMLVIVCLFVVVFESVFHQENKVLGLSSTFRRLTISSHGSIRRKAGRRCSSNPSIFCLHGWCSATPQDTPATHCPWD